jgi:hypothetical protein
VAYQSSLSSLVRQLDDVFNLNVTVDLRLVPAQIFLTSLDLEDTGFRRSRLLSGRELSLYTAQDERRKALQKELLIGQYQIRKQQDTVAGFIKKSQAKPLAMVPQSYGTLRSKSGLASASALAAPLRANPYSSRLLQSQQPIVSPPKNTPLPPIIASPQSTSLQPIIALPKNTLLQPLP